MKNLSKLGLAIIIVASAVLVAFLLFKSKREAKKEPPVAIVPTVEALTLQPEVIELRIPSQGIIEPITQTNAAAEVAGRIVKVYPAFEPGESFSEGDILLEIDDADYTAAYAQAVAAREDAKLALELEYAKRDQAMRDWAKLKTNREPSALVQRIPQVASAEARVEAALAAVEKAARDLERTRFRAPYDGRVKSTSTDLGSYATPGAPLAEIYRTDILEIRLPVALDDFAFVDNSVTVDKKPLVNLRTEVAGTPYDWTARVIRTEGQVDRSSRSVYLVARIDTQDLSEKYRNVNIDLIAPGLFVDAEIQGLTLKDVFRVPRKAFYTPDSGMKLGATRQRVMMLDEDNRLYLQDVKVSRIEGEYLIIERDGGLEPGQRVCITALEAVIEGTKVKIAGETPALEPLAPASVDAKLTETEAARP